MKIIALYIISNPIWGGGDCSTLKISSETLKWPPSNQVLFLNFSIWNIWKAKNFLIFQIDFGFLEGGGKHPPSPSLNVYFQPDRK